jgi:hypothetical protein
MKFSIYFTTLISVLLALNDPKCDRLPNGCKLKSYYTTDIMNTNRRNLYVCDKIDLDFKFDETQMDQIRNCSSSNPEVKEALTNFYFQLSTESILDGSFDLLNNELLLSTETELETTNGLTMYEFVLNVHNQITFRFIKGFDIGKFKKRNVSIRLEFYYSKLEFYSNRSLIRSCDDFKSDFEYLFNAFLPSDDEFESVLYDVRFYNSEYNVEICPIILLFMRINALRFFGVQNTFYKRNYPKFVSNFTFNKTGYDLVMPLMVDFINMQNIELNSVILNPFLFSNIYILRLFGDIVSIEKGLFKSFKTLRQIHLDMLSIKKLMHNGIDWLLELNELINFDFNDKKPYYNEDHIIKLLIYNHYEQGVVDQIYYDTFECFPDEDFCLYAKFPFQQLILMVFNIIPTKISCTFTWISWYGQIIANMSSDNSVYIIYALPNISKEEFERCDFKKR